MPAQALARLFRLLGNDPDEGRMIERAFTLEPTRFEATRIAPPRLPGGDEGRGRDLVARLASDSALAGEPFRRVVGARSSPAPTPIAARLLNDCRIHVSGEPVGLGWLGETAALNKVFDPIPVLVDAAATGRERGRLAAAGHSPRRPSVLQEARQSCRRPRSSPCVRSSGRRRRGSSRTQSLRHLRSNASMPSRLAMQLSRNDRTQATKVLEQYASKDVSATDAAWTKRNLAMLYAVGGAPDDRNALANSSRTCPTTASHPKTCDRWPASLPRWPATWKGPTASPC